MYFDQRGDVRACCQNTHVVLGNVTKQSLHEIWRSADAERMRTAEKEAGPGYSSMGTTLSANALQFKAMRANLEHVMTPAAYDHMLPLSEKLARGIEGEIKKRNIPWHVSNVGARAEFVCAPQRPRNGTEAQAAMDLSELAAMPPEAACINVRSHIVPGDPESSPILIVTDPTAPAVHMYKFAGNKNKYAAFKQAVSPWIMAEK